MFDIPARRDLVIEGHSATVLPQLADATFQLIYIDPPFNTGGKQKRTTVTTTQDDAGDRVGFGDRRYRTTAKSTLAYDDMFDDYLGFLGPLLEQAHQLLRADGTLFVHLDQREAHYIKVALDQIFGRNNFLNEIIWAYDYGGRGKDRWARKHDTILVYTKQLGSHVFNQDEIERIPYMAPGLVSKQKAARGKLPTDVWWHTIVATNGREKTGYPTQKPEGVLRRVIAPSTTPDGMVLDFFAGSGTTGAVARQLGRQFVLVDQNPAAIDIITQRLGADSLEVIRSD